jgi:hypothetical protein
MRQQRMSRKELTDEAKESEGDPCDQAAAPPARLRHRDESHAERRAEGGRGDREPAALCGGAQVGPDWAAARRSASPREPTRSRSGSGRSRSRRCADPARSSDGARAPRRGKDRRRDHARALPSRRRRHPLRRRDAPARAGREAEMSGTRTWRGFCWSPSSVPALRRELARSRERRGAAGRGRKDLAPPARSRGASPARRGSAGRRRLRDLARRRLRDLGMKLADRAAAREAQLRRDAARLRPARGAPAPRTGADRR